MDDTGARLMRATKAYIASLGTTGVLLAASVLMLAVVSGVVAFDHWPGGNGSTRVQTLTLREKAAPVRVSPRVPARVAGHPATRAPAARAAAVAGGTTAAGTVGGRRITAGLNAPARSPAPSPAPVRPITAVPPAATAPLQPVQDAANPVVDAISNPSTTTSRVADGVQGLTDSVGVSLGQVSPELGGAVAATGQAAAETVRQLPLP